MQDDVALGKLAALERGDGIQRSRQLARKLSLGAFAICLLTGAAATLLLHDARSLLLAPLWAAVGWMVAERNALESRVALWPILRQYIDWARVEAKLPAPP